MQVHAVKLWTNAGNIIVGIYSSRSLANRCANEMKGRAYANNIPRLLGIEITYVVRSYDVEDRIPAWMTREEEAEIEEEDESEFESEAGLENADGPPYDAATRTGMYDYW